MENAGGVLLYALRDDVCIHVSCYLPVYRWQAVLDGLFSLSLYVVSVQLV